MLGSRASAPRGHEPPGLILGREHCSMNVSLLRRSLVASTIVVASALVAIGCGGSSGSGAADAVKDSKGLEYVPADAILYATFDTDLEGDNWKQVDELSPALSKE